MRRGWSPAPGYEQACPVHRLPGEAAVDRAAFRKVDELELKRLGE